MSSSNFNKGEWPNDSKDVAEDYELEEMPDSKKRKLWTRRPPPSPPASMDHAGEIPLAKASLFGEWTYTWLSPLLRTGFRRHLQPTDLWKMDQSREALTLSAKFMANLEKRQKRAAEWNAKLPTATPAWNLQIKWAILAIFQRHLPQYAAYGSDSTYAERRATLESEWRSQSGRKRGSLAWALSDTLPRFWWAGPYKIVGDLAMMMVPLLIKELIIFAAQVDNASLDPSQHRPSIGRGIGLAIGILVLGVVQNTAVWQFFWVGEHQGTLARATLISATYQRAFALSVGPRARYLNKVMTYVSADISRIEAAAGFIQCIWTSPVALIVNLIMLCLQIGPSALVGFAVFLLAAPVQTWVMKYGMKLREKSVKWTEGRTTLLQSILSSMATVKMFTYETPYFNRLNDMRKKELVGLRGLLFSRSAVEALAFTLPTFASVFGLLAYTTLHPTFDLARIIAAVSYFGLLGPPLMQIPIAVSLAGDAMTAVRRLQEFFEAELSDDDIEIDLGLDVAIRTTHATFQWPTAKEGVSGNSEKKKKLWQRKKAKAKETDEQPPTPASPQEPFKIEDLDLEIPRGRLVAIVGAVGSGKSSILHGLLGEMRSISGKVVFGGTVSYCSQTAWIQNATIRDNVLFGQPWDESRYWNAIKQACLLPDLEILPDGDLTELGEKGITISGGQKQRINIARAIYFDADILLLDDPLSAVDAHVGKALFDNVILGLRKAGKTIILVTHALHFLSKVDYIYSVDNGQIVEEGTFADLMAHGDKFQQLVGEFGGGGSTSDEEEDAGPTLKGKEIEEVDLGEDFDLTANLPLEGSQKLHSAGMGKAAGTGGAEGRLILEEERKTGAVGWRVYAAYLVAGNASLLVPAILLSSLSTGGGILSTVWLTWWQAGKFDGSLGFYQGVYAALGASRALFMLLSGMVMAVMSMRASKNVFSKALKSVMFSPMSFFDSVPIGRLVGIFGKDLDSIDNQLSEEIRQLFLVVVTLIGAVIVITISLPYFLAIVVVVGFGYMALAYYYRNSSREVRRIDAMLRSNLYAHFSESLTGITTVRAYGEVDRFMEENAQKVDTENRAHVLTVAMQLWLGVRLSWLGALLNFSVALMCACRTGRGGLSAAQVALCLSYMAQTTGMLSSVAQLSTMVENSMNGMERVLYYSDGNIPQDPPYEIEATEPKGPWPSDGRIELDKVVMSYRKGLPPALKGVSVKILPGERVGIVGRTGAGKTTITVALYRLTELTSGSISIDGIDISTIGLKTLRSSLAAIPQEPVLFSGTLRSNLDPFDACDDEQLYDALRRACLLNSTPGSPSMAENGDEEKNTQRRFTLDMTIDEGGSNLSIGERSLVSLARALVRNARIMVLDEATASVDLETDAKIQKAIRADCNKNNKTLLCIAHRLRTVIGWDKIIVMDKGEIIDFASPLELFDNTDGTFRAMCNQSNITREEIAIASAEERI